ncbi:PaREP1 family protein [Pyrolobus fumarii 1A]|uniref:PaREP1 family protein n=1 Tax=Pyrolobus fumarii (strain DSM 11204 / 1A) TaxID=694429 RepID=G0EH05_PYRF1|nr:PaREP1 family protein [Pyrolobus fumarii]AEM38455.1 PaREP1 family protein [Pyrolobus fumarii 1A]
MRERPKGDYSLFTDALLRSSVSSVSAYVRLLLPSVEMLVKISTTALPPRLRGRRDVDAASSGWGTRLARARARLAKAWRLLAEGLGDEAGEEAWRATIDAINAAAIAAWGIEAKSHQALRIIVAELYREGLDIRSEFGVAEALHNNYYDPGHPPETLQAMIANVERLIDRVEAWITTRTEKPRLPLIQPLAPLLPANLIRSITIPILRPVTRYG